MAGEITQVPMDLLLPRNYEAPASGGAQTAGSGKGSINTLGSGQVQNNEAQNGGWGGVSHPTPTSSAEAGTKVSTGDSVDLVSGQNSCWHGGKK